MVLAAICCLAFSAQQGQADKGLTDRPTLLVIYKEHSTTSQAAATATGNDMAGGDMHYERLGLVNWTVLDGGVQGVPCRIYKGDGSWVYTSSIHNTARKEYHTASFTMQYNVGLDGVPLHSESHFSNQSDDTYKTIDVVAEYRADHIDETVTTNGQAEQTQIYPSFGMERFAGMFEPMIRSGLVQSETMDCAVLHPYTGMPYEFKLKLRGRFTGHYFFIPQEGYCIDVLGSEGNGKIFITRQGQLLQDELTDRLGATLEEGPDARETEGWGHFNITDWNKSTDETNPERPTYHTLAVPVLFQNPRILFPVPCGITD